EWRSLCAMVPALAPMAALGFRQRQERRAVIDDALSTWLRPRDTATVARELRHAGIAAAALASSRDLVASDHLQERGFWDAHRGGVLPGLPWRASLGRSSGAAPGLGADTNTVLAEVLSLSQDDIARLRKSGALG
ncbi:MAG: CoA transferase, partial [Stellaceae bacterium]